MRDIFASETWISFYLWRCNGVPKYVGQAINVEGRNRKRKAGCGKDAIGRDIAAHLDEYNLETLHVKVYDIPQGPDSVAVENTLIDLYDTMRPNGFNMIRAGENSPLNVGALGNAAANAKKDEDGKSIFAKKGGKAAAAVVNLIIHAQKDEDGKSILAKRMGKAGAAAAHAQKDEDGKSINGKKCAAAAHAQKDENGRSIFAKSGAAAANAQKDEDGKSIFAKRAATFANHTRWDVNRNLLRADCSLCAAGVKDIVAFAKLCDRLRDGVDGKAA